MRFIHFGLGSLVLMVSGCSSKQSSNGLNSLCPSSDPTNKAPAQLNLARGTELRLKDPSDPAIGMGYWDMNSTKADGTPVSRRCTVSIRPHPTLADAVLVFTAKHCNYDPQSHEFANAKSTFKLWANGGYFDVGVDFLNKKDIGDFSAALAPLVNAMDPDFSAKWEGETSSSGTQKCQLITTEKQQQLSSGYRLACTSAVDLLHLDAKLIVPEKYKNLIDEMIRILGTRGMGIASLNARDQELLVGFQRSDNLQVTGSATLRELAYALNVNFCAAPDGHRVTMRKASHPLYRGPWCSNPAARTYAALLAKTRIPVAMYDKHMKRIIEQPASSDFSDTSEIAALHDEIFGCHISSLNDVHSERVELFNSCDRGHFKKLMGQRWMKDYQERLAEVPAESRGKFGMNLSTYFTLSVNALSSQAAVNANDHSKSIARIFTLAATNRLFQFSVDTGLDFLIFAFSPTADKMFFTKKDSGSLLSILGNFPFAALSTIDGEPTSGGAAITPLPSVEVDEPVMPTRRPANGC